MPERENLQKKEGIPPPVKNPSSGKKQEKERYSYSDKEKTQTPGKFPILLLGGMIFLIIILGIGILVFLNQNDEENPPSETLNITENKTNEIMEEDEDQLLLETAFNESNESLCMDISNETMKQLCYESFANMSLDACKNVKNKTIKTECIRKHATTLSDLSVCEYLEKGIMECKADINDCYAITNADEREFCFALKEKDTEYCEGNDKCIYDMALELKDEQICDGISDNVSKYSCRAVILDQDECHHMSEASKKDLCRLRWAKASGDKMICTMLRSEKRYALDCYSYFAVSGNDPLFCKYNDALTVDNLWSCYKNYSISTGNLKGCDLIHEWAPTSRFTCYFKVAKKYGNPKACDSLDDPSKRNTCYVGSIIDNSNLDYRNCENVNSVVWKNKCYTEYAKMVGDPSYCEYIDQTNERQVCYNAFEYSQQK